MLVHNRIGVDWPCRAFNATDTVRSFSRPGAPELLRAGETTSFDEKGNEGGIQLLLLPTMSLHKLDNGKEYILCLPENSVEMIDWTAIQQKWDPQQWPEQQRDEAKGLLMWGTTAYNIISLFLSGLESVPGLGLVTGPTDKMLQMILVGIDEANKPPQLPGLQLPAIEATVRRAVKEELDRMQAQQAASHFLLASEWYDRKVRLARSRRDEKWQAPTDAQADDLIKQIKSYLDDSHSGFAWSVGHLRQNPEIAMWMLPAFILGLGLYLQFRRLDQVYDYICGTPVTSQSVERQLELPTDDN